ncbi:MAG: hypothetical protein MHM6MM_007906 [Cercozoa sp. M6MM]
MPGHVCQTLVSGTGCALPPGATGCGSVGDDDNCAGAAECVDVGGTPTCLVPTGGACQASKQCQGLMACVSGTCQALDITFTPCGATGSLGPSSSDCAAEHAATGFASRLRVSNSGSDMGAQFFSLPADGCYEITAVGASGGLDTDGSVGTTGFGAQAVGRYLLSENDELIVVVGQQGESVENCGGGAVERATNRVWQEHLRQMGWVEEMAAMHRTVLIKLPRKGTVHLSKL